MADFSQNLRNAWAKGMAAVSSTAGELAQNARQKADEHARQELRSNMLRTLGEQVYSLYQQGAVFQPEVMQSLNELYRLDAQQNAPRQAAAQPAYQAMPVMRPQPAYQPQPPEQARPMEQARPIGQAQPIEQAQPVEPQPVYEERPAAAPEEETKVAPMWKEPVRPAMNFETAAEPAAMPEEPEAPSLAFAAEEAASSVQELPEQPKAPVGPADELDMLVRGLATQRETVSAQEAPSQSGRSYGWGIKPSSPVPSLKVGKEETHAASAAPSMPRQEVRQAPKPAAQAPSLRIDPDRVYTSSEDK